MPLSRRAAFVLAVSLASGCTYGPPEDRAVAHTIRVPDTRSFFAAVHHERFQLPTGVLNTFPNGGTPRMLGQEVYFYRASSDTGAAHRWATMEVPEELSTAFGVHPIGAAPDTLWVRISGCPGSECWGDLREQRSYRLALGGDLVEVDSVPRRHRAPGSRVAPRPGETRYMRMGRVHHDTIRARLTYPDGDPRALFVVRPTGELRAIDP